jgi:hypothetical protein
MHYIKAKAIINLSLFAGNAAIKISVRIVSDLVVADYVSIYL